MARNIDTSTKHRPRIEKREYFEDEATLGHIFKAIDRLIEPDRFVEYTLEPCELHLLEMAERRAVRIRDKDVKDADIVWRWIARRSGVDFESIHMKRGTQMFYAVPLAPQLTPQGGDE